MMKLIFILCLLCASVAQATEANSSSTGSVSSNVSGTATNQGNAQSITVNEPASPDKMTIRSAPSIVAPSLTTTMTETCMGSTAGGVSGIAFGVTFGSTWTDGECVNRLNARELRTFGDLSAAREVMCENKVVRAAYKRTGKPCVGD